jgi:hypothetical protein
MNKSHDITMRILRIIRMWSYIFLHEIKHKELKTRIKQNVNNFINSSAPILKNGARQFRIIHKQHQSMSIQTNSIEFKNNISEETYTVEILLNSGWYICKQVALNHSWPARFNTLTSCAKYISTRTGNNTTKKLFVPIIKK